MKHIFRLACGLTLIAFLAHGANAPSLPNVLIIGDSISIGYTGPAREILKGKANVVHNPGNAQHSGFGAAQLEAWLGDTRWDVIHFNHGLHDLKYVDEEGKNSNTREGAHIQVPLADYRSNMEAIVLGLKKTGAALIFATTTPFPEGVKPFRSPGDVAKYNDVALDIMTRNGITVNDLYTFALPRLESIQKPVNVHFHDKGSRELAEEVARHISNALGEQP